MEKEILLVIALIIVVVVIVIGMPLYFNSKHSGNLQSEAPSTTIASSKISGSIAGQASNNSNISTTTSSTTMTATVATTAYTTIPSVNSNFVIQTGLYNNSILGDGISTLVIPITIFDAKTNEPLTTPIQVQAQTSIGSVSYKCPAPSICNITFQSPATLKMENATISIDTGGTLKTFQITVMPALPTNLYLSVAPSTFFINSSVLYINGGHGRCYTNGQYNTAAYIQFHQQNFSIITVYASDKNNNPTPNGTVINLSANIGTLSNSLCITQANLEQINTSWGSYTQPADSCSVIYKPIPEVSNVTIYAHSYNVSSSSTLNITSSYVTTCPNIINN